MKKLLIFAASLLATMSLMGQDYRMEARILKQENEALKYTVDSLRWALADKDVELIVPWSHLTDGRAPADPEYEEGLMMIDREILVEYTDVIKQYLDFFNVAQKRRMGRIAALYQRQQDYIEGVFEAYGIPADIGPLCIVESAMNPNAVSSAGAVGLWQLMPQTAQQYGLQMIPELDYDERRDIEKATPVAATLLAANYRRYGSWPLAISAYNCGPGAMDAAVTAAGTTDYWTVWDLLPKETQGFLPSLMGVLYYLKINEEQ